MDDDDLALAALLAEPALEPDPVFAANIAALVEAEARFAAARRAAWRRFGGEALSAAGVAIAALAVSRLSGDAGTVMTGPGLAAALALVAWLATRTGTQTAH